MELIRTVEELRRYRAGASRVALVPTMGALHEGHLAHLRAARPVSDRLIVSVFVNPTQFGPHEDFEQYPRDLETDAKRCAAEGADAVFAPGVEEVYPPDAPAARVNVPSVAADLEGRARPGHFEGVCRVVLKLFNIVRPDLATFGRKDYQQLAVIRAMVDDLLLPIELLEVQTVREPDGLAMSSRNAYLGDDNRRRAPGLITALRQGRALAAAGQTDPAALEAAMHAIVAEHRFDPIDYIVVRDRRTLAPLPPGFDPADAVALGAATLGQTRLIDNLLLAS